MWRVVSLSLIVLTFTLGCATPIQKMQPERAYQKRYPHTVLGDDYGLLTERDVAISSCVAHPSPFSTLENSAHPYWQCFSLKGAAFECEPADENEGGPTAILAIVLKKEHTIHDFLSRRAIPKGACEDHKADWIRLTSNQEYVCVSGAFISAGPNEQSRSWVFESYKTKKGCDSYFKGGCSLSFKVQQGCNLAVMTRTKD